MKMKIQFVLLSAIGPLWAGLSVRAANPPTSTNGGYVQANLVSDLGSNALHKDTRLVNPWGIVAGPDSVWVNDNGTGRTTVYGLFGGLSSFTISILPQMGVRLPLRAWSSMIRRASLWARAPGERRLPS